MKQISALKEASTTVNSQNFQFLQNLLEVSIEGSRQRYYSRLTKKNNVSIHKS